MPCKACHKPKEIKPIVGQRYTGPFGEYVFTVLTQGKYAFVNIGTGETWSGARDFDEITKDMKFMKLIRRIQ